MKAPKINIRRMILFHKFDQYVNMSPGDVRLFKNTEEGKNVSQTKEEASIQGGLAGKEASQRLEKIVSKCTGYRNQFKKLPPLSEEEWRFVASCVRMIARFRELPGPVYDEDGNEMPRILSLKYWFHDYTKYKKKLPSKEEIKKDVVSYVKDVREKFRKEREKEEEKKATPKNESYLSTFLDIL